MIYKQPSIYKQGGGNGAEVHTSILEYADDWKNITNDFSLVGSSLVYIDHNTQGTLEDLNIKFSKKLKVIYFDCVTAWLIGPSQLPINSWARFLIYNGNEFETIATGGTNPSHTTFSIPSDVNKGMVFMNLMTSAGSTRDFGMIQYIGDNVNNSGIGIKRISNYDTPTGFGVQQCAFNVIPK